MSKNRKKCWKNRRMIHKGSVITKNTVLFLYGKIKHKQNAVAFCKLHNCYLEKKDIKEKKCNRKDCKYKINLKNGEIENEIQK